jgi:CubicO group peptidase (beta-lactamase class C family)
MRVLQTPIVRGGAPSWADLSERMARRGVPGVSLAVIEGDEVVRAEGFGVREAGGADPVTPETLFLAGSISKPLAAVGALRLVEQGRLALDADVNGYLRSWRLPASGGWQPRITLRQLLSHTAGLTVHGFPGYPRDAAIPTLVQVLDGEPPANTPPIRVNLLPGVQFRYSGGGYCVLQQLMVDVTGRPFPELMAELVLGPAGMARSTYENPLPEARWAEAATGHRAGAKPVAGKWHVYPEMAAAGLWSTPTDLARFAIELRRAASGRPSGLLSSGTAAQMLTRVVRTDRSWQPEIGLGLFLNGTGEKGRFGHSGSDEGFVSALEAYREQPHGAVVMTNADEGGAVIQELMRGLAADHGWPAYTPEPPEAVAVEPTALARHAGTYELEIGKRVVVRPEPNGLSIELDGQAPVPIRPRAQDRFFAEVVNLDVDLGPDGLTLRQDGVEVAGRRLEPGSP